VAQLTFNDQMTLGKNENQDHQAMNL